jgi:hypothetical protein
MVTHPDVLYTYPSGPRELRLRAESVINADLALELHAEDLALPSPCDEGVALPEHAIGEQGLGFYDPRVPLAPHDGVGLDVPSAILPDHMGVFRRIELANASYRRVRRRHGSEKTDRAHRTDDCERAFRETGPLHSGVLSLCVCQYVNQLAVGHRFCICEQTHTCCGSGRVGCVRPSRRESREVAAGDRLLDVVARTARTLIVRPCECVPDASLITVCARSHTPVAHFVGQSGVATAAEHSPVVQRNGGQSICAI